MYRKKVFLPLLAFILLACNPPKPIISYFEEPESSYFIESLLTWEELFSIPESYFIYIYSETCYHCQMIKDDVLDFANNSVFPVYFVEFNENIPIGNEIENTIGATTVEECFIKGTPTLFLIENNKLTMNIAGTGEILKTIDLYRR